MKPCHTSNIIIELTNRCNLKCIHCFNNTNVDKISELSTEEILQIIHQAKKNGITFISLTGGEVFIRRDIEEILQEIDRVEIAFTLNTNGSHRDSRPLDLVAKYRPKCVQVSVDGPKEVHDRIRGIPGSFDRTYSFLRMVDLLDIPITLQFTAMQETINELSWFFDFAQIFTHLRGVKVTAVAPIGRAACLDHLEPHSLTTIWQSLQTLLHGQPPFKVTTELLDKKRLISAYHSFRLNPNSFLMAIIKPNGFVHPFFGLPQAWNYSHAISNGLCLSEKVAENALFATTLAFRHGADLLANQAVIDFNALLVESFASVTVSTGYNNRSRSHDKTM